MQNGFQQSNLPKSISPSAGVAAENVARWNSVPGMESDLMPQWGTPLSSTNKTANGGKSNRKDKERHSQGNQNAAGGTPGTKRYTCSSCPYSTDRRDLYTRHENIHKPEKPFHCFACQKGFNRADHVKKHFLRMHREMDYDINKTRRPASSTASTSVAAPPIPPPVTTVTQVIPVLSSRNYYDDQQQVDQLTGHFNGYQTEQILSTLDLPPTSSSTTSVIQVQPQPLPVSNLSPNIVGVVKQETGQSLSGAASSSGSPDKKRDKRFVCVYCPWSGSDNWGLKRHLNTHTKPYVCVLCDYKAARSERLVTHVYKVHNKKGCNKCSYLADDHAQLVAHQSEAQ